jgi:hypothetical protein
VVLGADLDLKTPGTLPPILEAAQQYHGGVVLRLLQVQANPGLLTDIKDNESCSTLLHMATQFRHERDSRTVISLLLKSEDADINAVVRFVAVTSSILVYVFPKLWWSLGCG